MKAGARRRFRPGKRLRVGASVAAAFVLLCAAGPARAFEVVAGQQHLITLPNAIERLSIGNGEVADAQVTGNSEIRVLGLKPGKTDLIIWMHDGGGNDARRTYPIVVVPDLDGLRNLLRGDPTLAGLSAAWDGTRVELRGTATGVEAHDKAMSLLQSYGLGVTDASSVQGQQTVAVDIKFAAVSVSALKKLGLNYRLLEHGFQSAITNPNSVQQFGFGANSGSGNSGISLTAGLPIADAFNLFLAAPHANFAAIISALNGTNAAHFLAEPTLIARSGRSASFIAGGEVPIPVPSTGNSSSATIEYHDFGVRLTITPTVLSDRRIALDVAPEVSELDFSNALTVNGFNVPAFQKRAASTSIDLADGQSFILAGLMYSTSQDVDQRVPGLGDIPIIGAFFKSTQHQENQQELIIIATPHLVAPMKTESLPPLPGQPLGDYHPSIADMMLDRNTVGETVAKFGLLH